MGRSCIAEITQQAHRSLSRSFVIKSGSIIKLSLKSRSLKTCANGCVPPYMCSSDFINFSVQDPDEKHHVIKMTEHFYFRNHLCIAMELLSINLYELIKANGFVGFTTNLIRRFTSQMLASLALMRQHHIVHCDLKPEVRKIRMFR